MRLSVAIHVRWLACAWSLWSCSSHESTSLTSADAGREGHAEAGALDAARPAQRSDAGLDGAVTSLDGAVVERAIDQLVQKRLAVGGSSVCALNAVRDIVCWGSSTFAEGEPREEHTPLKGPFDGIDMTSDSLSDDVVCGVQTDAGVRCQPWNETGFIDTDFMRWTQEGHVAAFTLDHLYGESLIAIDTDGGVSLVIDGMGTRPSLNTGRRAVQVERSASYLCVRDESGRVQCSYGADDGGTIVEDAPDDVYRDIAVLEFGACGINAQERVRCWEMNKGEDTSSEGFAHTTSSDGTAPRQLASNIHFSESEICALLKNGHVWCADNTTFAPSRLSFGAGAAVELAIGDEGVCFVAADDALRCVPRQAGCQDGGCPMLDARYRVPDGFVLAPR